MSEEIYMLLQGPKKPVGNSTQRALFVIYEKRSGTDCPEVLHLEWGPKADGIQQSSKEMRLHGVGDCVGPLQPYGIGKEVVFHYTKTDGTEDKIGEVVEIDSVQLIKETAFKAAERRYWEAAKPFWQRKSRELVKKIVQDKARPERTVDEIRTANLRAIEETRPSLTDFL